MITELHTVLLAATNPCTSTSPPTACQPSWLDTGSNSWQLTAATFVGLMSLPGLALLYGGLVPRKWVVNTMFMAFSGFSLVLVVWVLWAYKMGFGSPIGGGHANTYDYKYGSNFFKNFFYNFVGHPETSLRGTSQISQASLPIGTALPLSQATTSLFYFQFVFAAITPLLFLGSVLGRIKIKVWMVFVPLWTTFVYAINAMLVWGGGYWSHEGAVDYSGGYVIHLAAGTSGFVAAWLIGPRLARDRQRFVPHSLPLVSIGAGIIWLGWNGFNGGDPYFASADAATAIVNTNLATVSALLVWVFLDMFLGKEKKPTFLGAINGMIVGLVSITPGAGYVNGLGAMLSAAIASTIVWFAWTYLQPIIARRVDDAMGVVYTHGLAGLCGGLLVGIFADPSVVVYPNTTSGTPFAVTGWFYGNRHLFFLQLLAALTIIVWDALVTFLILKIISIFTPLRMPDADLEIGDLAIHGEEAYPSDEGFVRVGAGSAAPVAMGATGTSEPELA
ncbi:MAG: ammonium transporter [Frankiales bacterium]|nr:ammonium transporter [Frankiales bacterium]